MTRVERILKSTEPAQMINRIRRIWPEIEQLHASGLLYRQICEKMPAEFGIKIEYKRFLSVCRRIKRSTKQILEISSLDAPAKNRPGLRADPIKAALEKSARDNRGSNILAGKE